MQTFKLKSAVLSNFKKYRNKTIQFGENKTTFSGENEVGKTSIATSFFWLFNDKDYKLKSNPNVRIEENGKPVDDVHVSTEIVAEINGKETIIKKTQKQTKNRKGEINGTVNSYELNSCEKNKGDLEKWLEIELGIDMKKILACTNPNMFTSQNQADMREVLFGMETSLTDLEIAQGDKKFSKLAELLEKHTTDEIKAMNQASKTKLTKEIDAKEIRIDERSKDIVTIDIAELELQKNALKEQIEGIDKQLTDTNESVKAVDKLSNEIMQTQFSINDVKRKANEELFAKRKEIQKQIDDIETMQSQTARKRSSVNSDITDLEESISKNNKIIESCKTELTTENAKVFDESKWVFDETRWVFDEKSVICPLCNREYEADKVEQIKAEFEQKKADEISLLEHKKNTAKKLFEVDKNNNIESIKTKGNNAYLTIKADKDTLAKLQSEFEQIKADVIALNAQRNALEMQLNALPSEVDLTDNTEIKALESKLENLNATYESMKNSDNVRGDLETQKSNLLNEINEIQKKIDSADNTDTENQIETLKYEKKVLQNSLNECEHILYLCDELSNEKDDLLVDKINSHFSIVKWKLFEYYKTTNDKKKVCIPMIDDFTFGDSTNQARDISAQIDICNSLQKFFGVKLPIFLDGAESINKKNIPNVDCQLVLFKVSDDNELKVEVE